MADATADHACPDLVRTRKQLEGAIRANAQIDAELHEANELLSASRARSVLLNLEVRDGRTRLEMEQAKSADLAGQVEALTRTCRELRDALNARGDNTESKEH